MMKKAIALLAVMGATCSLFANVDLRTNIRDIYYRGTCEEAGSITMSVNGDDFSEASTAQPVFVRVRLDQGATLCQTLVNNRNDAPNVLTNNVPIYLAMRIESSLSASSVGIVAPGDTISIVRWKAGESDIWLRVSTPSDQWVFLTNGGLQAPDNQIRVAWTFGVTARTSQLTNDKPGNSDYENGLANLPFNTRNNAAFADRANLAGDVDTNPERAVYAQSTLVCIDVSNATFLEPAPAVNSIVEFDTISFIWNEANDPEGPLGVGLTGFNPNAEEHDGNVRTATNPASILQANQAQATFSGDDSIARGYDLACAISTSKDDPTNTSLCFNESIINQQGDTNFGLICTTVNTIRVTILGCFGWNTDSRITLETPAGADYGFRVYKTPQGNTVSDSTNTLVRLDPSRFSLSQLNAGVGMGFEAWAPKSALFSAINESNALSAVALIRYTDLPSITTPDPTLLLGVSVCIDPTSAPQPIALEGTVSVTNKDTARDRTPYDGIGASDFNYDVVNASGTRAYQMTEADQYQFCPPKATVIGTFAWEYGDFDECVSFTRIFYPYIPGVAGNPTFWSGISFVNQGSSDLDSVFGYIWEADGSGWITQFPALPRRNQQTWLLQDSNGVAFIDTEGVLEPRTLSPLGNDIVPLNQRSSMFILGIASGQTNADVRRPDLDGFCLIGNTETKVIYGYLPRNVEVTQFLQDGDLPPNFVKQHSIATDGAKFEGAAIEIINHDFTYSSSPYSK